MFENVIVVMLKINNNCMRLKSKNIKIYKVDTQTERILLKDLKF